MKLIMNFMLTVSRFYSMCGYSFIQIHAGSYNCCFLSFIKFTYCMVSKTIFVFSAFEIMSYSETKVLPKIVELSYLRLSINTFL